eukprot:SAG31_NODE_2254_length_6073_cov_3.048711_2_plen_158_part_00
MRQVFKLLLFDICLVCVAVQNCLVCGTAVPPLETATPASTASTNIAEDEGLVNNSADGSDSDSDRCSGTDDDDEDDDGDEDEDNQDWVMDTEDKHWETLQRTKRQWELKEDERSAKRQAVVGIAGGGTRAGQTTAGSGKVAAGPKNELFSSRESFRY